MLYLLFISYILVRIIKGIKLYISQIDRTCVVHVIYPPPYHMRSFLST